MSRPRSSPPVSPSIPRPHRVREARRFFAAALTLLGVAQVGLASEPLTGQFQVNTFTGSAQYRPAVATDAAGNFVVAWESFGSGASSNNDNSGISVQARRFDPNGNAIGSDFQVNSSTANNQRAPSVAMSPSGTFVIVWQSAHVDINNTVIMAQRYASNGTKVGTELTVGSGGVNDKPSVAMADNGDFVVVWRNNGVGGVGGDSNENIQGRRFDQSGGTFFNQFLVNNVTSGVQDDPVVATDGDLSYLVAWEDGNNDIAIRYFTANDSLGEGMSADAIQETANSEPGPVQVAPSVAMAPDGRAAVVWEANGSLGTDHTLNSIQTRRLDSGGAFVDPTDVQINTWTPEDQRFASVAMSSSGIAAVTWASYGSPGDTDWSVQFRGLAPPVDPIEALDPSDVRANTVTTNFQWYPAAAFAPNGRLFVVWESNGTVPGGTDTNGFSIQGRLFDVFLFADGFETGDASRWSSIFQ